MLTVVFMRPKSHFRPFVELKFNSFKEFIRIGCDELRYFMNTIKRIQHCVTELCVCVYKLFIPYETTFLQYIESPGALALGWIHSSDESEPNWRIFSSARLGSWPFSLQLKVKNWPKTGRNLKTYLWLFLIVNLYW